jgi:predicted nucleotidyltransferase
MITPEALEKIRRFAEADRRIVAAYVFGSSATGKDRRGSDVDIAIMIQGSLDGFERVRLETLLSNVLGRNVDLVVFGRATPLLQHQVLKYGCLVYEADPKERIRQEMEARYQYLDTRCLYRMVAKDGAHGG